MSILVSEQLRPTTFDDLVLSVKLRERLKRMYDTRNVMNMLFYGKPGSGKTTAAKIFTESDDFTAITINGSIHQKSALLMKQTICRKMLKQHFVA